MVNLLLENIYFYLEYISLVSGLLFALFLVLNSPWAWVFSIISVSIQLILFYQTASYFLWLRSLYYLGISLYAYIYWNKSYDNANLVPIKSLSFKQNIFYFSLAVVISLLLYSLSLITSLQFSSPLLDACILAFALVGKYIQGKRFKVNFIYYIAIDSAAAVSCFMVGLYSLALLNTVFIIFDCYGYYNWRKIQQQENLAKSKLSVS